ncbi:rhodanese-related sulfurtransferase [Sporosarcina cyprini]|uniref:oxygen-dependent tRNA uridine(34) hydroxylase TrhO n=1 Tax=Sporosarcina cyprini TaxID=2910523 RepID=UPI001EDE8ACD|nr:rhodanese-related sulfurtransferase [Sporosarcina cyprini]MCG3089356.1 rhodanese-related sulfurtransferase [Sporosarcina cyprini]
MEKGGYRVLLFYKYVEIEDPETFTAEHLAFCKELGLKGRILIGKEGINGTCSGTIEQTDAYMAKMHSDERFKDLWFKIDETDGHAFKKMHVRYRTEIVNLSLDKDIDPTELTGEYLSPEEFYKQMQEENTVVLDARNDYEYDLGHFRGAVRPDIETFRELPEWIQENKEMFEGKKILAYCTGGIRCEKFTGWLKREGFEDVAHLHGGIVTYGKDPVVKGQLWDGQCYVFDERIAVPVNQVEHVVVGRDHFDGTPCERYVNCANPECNAKILCSEENEHLYMRSCSDECRTHPRNRYFVEHNMTVDEFNQRLEAIEKRREETAATVN